jgi:hypothetical protein
VNPVFTSTGATLKVKNNTTNEAIATPGKFVVSYEYKDSQGNIVVGVSNEVQLAESIPADAESITEYAFTFSQSIPSDAQNIKYWLVFRGKLGNEDDAIVAKLIMGCENELIYLVEGGYVIADPSTLEPLEFVEGYEYTTYSPESTAQITINFDPGSETTNTVDVQGSCPGESPRHFYPCTWHKDHNTVHWTIDGEPIISYSSGYESGSQVVTNVGCSYGTWITWCVSGVKVEAIHEAEIVVNSSDAYGGGDDKLKYAFLETGETLQSYEAHIRKVGENNIGCPLPEWVMEQGGTRESQSSWEFGLYINGTIYNFLTCASVAPFYFDSFPGLGCYIYDPFIIYEAGPASYSGYWADEIQGSLFQNCEQDKTVLCFKFLKFPYDGTGVSYESITYGFFNGSSLVTKEFPTSADGTHYILGRKAFGSMIYAVLNGSGGEGGGE